MRSRIMKIMAPQDCRSALALVCSLALVAPAQAGTGLNVAESWGARHGITTVTDVRSAPAPWAAMPLTYGLGTGRVDTMRIARLGLRGGFGTLAVEQQWLARAELTATAFQAPEYDRLRYADSNTGHTLSWTSPRLAGWSVGASYAQGLQQWQYGPSTGNRMFGAVSYSRGGLTLSGASNGASDWNLLGSYTEGRNTWRLALTRFDGDDEPVLRFGLDHRYSRSLTFFAAFQHEDDDAEPALRQRSFGMDSGIRSGRGIMTGLRYDF